MTAKPGEPEPRNSPLVDGRLTSRPRVPLVHARGEHMYFERLVQKSTNRKQRNLHVIPPPKPLLPKVFSQNINV